MMNAGIERAQAIKLLWKYNKETFHILHALTVEGVMRYFAKAEGFAEEVDYWGLVGLLHDIDYEMYPDEHCQKAPMLLREVGVTEEVIRSICSHGYGICSDISPEHRMEKVLYATDELTGLIFAAVRMRPSGSVMDLELSSLKKKFKDKRFAAGCDRSVIEQGAQMLDLPMDELLEKTILAMRSCEESVQNEITSGLEG